MTDCNGNYLSNHRRVGFLQHNTTQSYNQHSSVVTRKLCLFLMDQWKYLSSIDVGIHQHQYIQSPCSVDRTFGNSNDVL
jgi:hypothetical protein